MIDRIIIPECFGNFSPFWIKCAADLKNNVWKGLNGPSDPLSYSDHFTIKQDIVTNLLPQRFSAEKCIQTRISCHIHGSCDSVDAYSCFWNVLNVCVESRGRTSSKRCCLNSSQNGPSDDTHEEATQSFCSSFETRVKLQHVPEALALT